MTQINYLNIKKHKKFIRPIFIIGVILIIIPIIGGLSESINGATSGQDYVKWIGWVISGFIGRRSFATNYYGKINSALLISATGHASEQQFLRYVGNTGTQNALALAKEMRKFARNKNQEPKLTVVKSASIK